ncbi:MAG: CDP-alcohol phosphatidyltransferase family protein [Rhodospirillaceae bacterium]|nr:CDP-alcohol phosphatidyltransferase family protein [Rhodospirillaceae bacterium]
MSIPNILSLARLLSVPFVIWLLLSHLFTPAFWVFVTAGLTDAIDGYVAKRFNSRTVLGGYLDPVADKVMLVGVYLTLGYLGHIPIWLAILVVFRDLLIVGGVILLHTATEPIGSVRPTPVSKLNTVVQIALIAFVLARLGLGMDDLGVGEALVYLTGATTLVSGLDYLTKFGRRVPRSEGGN